MLRYILVPFSRYMNFTCDCLITLPYKARHFSFLKKEQARPTKSRDPSTQYNMQQATERTNVLSYERKLTEEQDRRNLFTAGGVKSSPPPPSNFGRKRSKMFSLKMTRIFTFPHPAPSSYFQTFLRLCRLVQMSGAFVAKVLLKLHW